MVQYLMCILFKNVFFVNIETLKKMLSKMQALRFISWLYLLNMMLVWSVLVFFTF